MAHATSAEVLDRPATAATGSQAATPTPAASDADARLQGSVGRGLDRIAVAFAMGGGLVFCALVLMSIVSIVGRKLFAAPLTGDVELMQMGAAVGAAAFLPLCELHDHHIRVDAITGWMPARAKSALDAVAHGALTMAAALITWRTTLAVLDGLSSGEVSTLLSVPMWQPVALLVPSFALLTACAAWRTVVAVAAANTGVAS